MRQLNRSWLVDRAELLAIDPAGMGEATGHELLPKYPAPVAPTCDQLGVNVG
jgi:hypothetical protein